MHGGEFFDGVLQRRAVVDARAEHRLRVELYAAFGKRFKLLRQARAPRRSEDAAAQERIHGVHGDVEGRGVAADDALKFAVGDVGEGHVIAHHQAHAPVVVLEAQRGPRVLGELIDKAEHALVTAKAHAGHQRLGKVQPQRLVFFLFDIVFRFHAGPARQQAHAAFGAEGLVIEKVNDCLAADAQKFVARADARVERRTACIYGNDLLRHSVLQNLHNEPFLLWPKLGRSSIAKWGNFHQKLLKRAGFNHYMLAFLAKIK